MNMQINQKDGVVFCNDLKIMKIMFEVLLHVYYEWSYCNLKINLFFRYLKNNYP